MKQTISGWQWKQALGQMQHHIGNINPILQGENLIKKEIMSKVGARIKESSKKFIHKPLEL